MKRTVVFFTVLLCLCGGLIAEQTRSPKSTQARRAQPSPAMTSAHPLGAPPSETLETQTSEPANAPAPRLPAIEPQVKRVDYAERDVVRVNTKLRYTTILVLPKNELILDVTCGDRDYWVVNGTQNLAYVKPAKAGSETNLNLIAASGNIYSFLLKEVSPEGAPDIKVFVDVQDEPMLKAADGPPRFVSSQVVEDYRQQVEIAKKETRETKEAAQGAIDRGISQFVSNVRFPYRFEAGKKPFFVRAIYTDEKFTFIQARPEETPTLYEVKDGQPNLVNFEYKNGVYVVQKVLDQGYLAIGKEKLTFKRED
jgi:type IV secretory pathway VirB9-like protein